MEFGEVFGFLVPVVGRFYSSADTFEMIERFLYLYVRACACMCICECVCTCVFAPRNHKSMLDPSELKFQVFTGCLICHVVLGSELWSLGLYRCLAVQTRLANS